MDMADALFIQHGLLYPSDESADILIQKGHIAAVGPDLPAPPPGTQTLDASGCIVTPGLIEAHCHLDKTLWGGPWLPERGASNLAGRIALKERNAQYGLPNEQYAAALLRQMVSCGTTHVRSHTDVDPEVGLRGIEMIQRVAHDLQAQVSVEQVAFPQSGIARAPQTAELLRSAAKMEGVTAIGGVDPAGVDGDPHIQYKTIFEIAEQAGLCIDIHIHDEGTLGAWELELLVEYTQALSLQGRVTVSHAFALGTVPLKTQQKLIESLAENRISVITAVPFDRAMLPIAALRNAGITLGLGNDNIQDLWSPYGNGDMLERASLLAYRGEVRTDAGMRQALDVATFGNAKLLGLPAYGIQPGCQADLVITPARTAGELVARHPTRRWVIKNGQLVS